MDEQIVAWKTNMGTYSYGIVREKFGESLFINRLEGGTTLIHESRVKPATEEQLEEICKRKIKKERKLNSTNQKNQNVV